MSSDPQQPTATRLAIDPDRDQVGPRINPEEIL